MVEILLEIVPWFPAWHYSTLADTVRVLSKWVNDMPVHTCMALNVSSKKAHSKYHSFQHEDECTSSSRDKFDSPYRLSVLETTGRSRLSVINPLFELTIVWWSARTRGFINFPGREQRMTSTRSKRIVQMKSVWGLFVRDVFPKLKRAWALSAYFDRYLNTMAKHQWVENSHLFIYGPWYR